MSRSLAGLLRVVKADRFGQGHISGRKIYILPTKYGFLFSFLLVILLIGSINYANSPAFLLTFLLSGMFVHTIFHTWRNLYGLQIRWLGCDPVFAGETASFRFRLSGVQEKAHHAIQLSYTDQVPTIIDCSVESDCNLTVSSSPKIRGRYRPGRLTVETRYPLGLLRAWSYLENDANVVVYPQPWVGILPKGTPDYQGSQSGDRGMGTDDFVGHRVYHPGDQPRHIDWKAYAKDSRLLIKQFGGDRVNLLWLDFSLLNDKDTEMRLSQLCGMILDLSGQALQYGLRLPSVEIAPAGGSAHRAECLAALALYDD